MDSRFSGGVIGTPVVGRFEGYVGVFEGKDEVNGITTITRYTWTLNPKVSQVTEKWERELNPTGAQVMAKWEQALSTDGGKTWETNWYNEFIHDDNCVPTAAT